jgi:outer membrane protein assembly factor BamE (lipoprotein component of BamABCDE complex)
MVKAVYLALLLISAIGWGCASFQRGGDPAAGSAQGGEVAEQAKTGVAAVPDDSPLAKIQIGMSDSEVRTALGEPSSQNAYMTGKSWIPFYYGPDASRRDYVYDGIGRVVFSRNQY